MMMTILGFPGQMSYEDVKTLIKRESNLNDFILDNLVTDKDGTKKVRIGLSDESEGYTLIKCLDGYRMGGKFILKVVPIKRTVNPPAQNSFDARPGFPNQGRNEYPPRNDYPPRSDYQNPNDFNRGAHGPGPRVESGAHGPGPHGPGPHGPGPHRSDAGRPSPWVQNSNSSQWGSPMAAPVPQNFGYQGQPNSPGYGQQHPGPHTDLRQYPQGGRPQEQGYGFPPKNADRSVRPMETRPQPVLRNIETMEPGNRYPPSNRGPPIDKPVTILKENFQGPTQFNIASPSGGPNYQGPGSQWHQRQQSKPEPFSKPSPHGYEKPPFEGPPKYLDNRDMPKNQHMRPDYDKPRRFSPGLPPHGRRHSPDRRMSPPSARGMSPPGRRISPSGRRLSPPGRRMSPPGRRMSPPGRRMSPSGRRISPPGRRISPPGRRISPPARRISPPGRRISPPGRRISPSGRRISPPGRRVSPSGRRISPPGGRISPPGRRGSPPVRRMSPSGRRISPPGGRVSPGRRGSPPGRRISPSGRRISPHGRKFSPSERRISPGNDRRMMGRPGSPPRRRESPFRPGMRYSPGRHHQGTPPDKYLDPSKGSKQIRPAYEPPNQAPNQAMYSGGYRPGVHENDQFSGGRPIDQHMSPWKREGGDYMKKEDERRMADRDSRVPEKILEHPIRKSRSPVRRDRSPIRDRFKRDSPSPRSPRRSWAFEKRRSPDIREAPPPPSWPGQNTREKIPDDRPAPDYRHGRQFPDKDPQRPNFSEKHEASWERPVEGEFRGRRDENKSPFDKRHEREMPRSVHDVRYAQREPKFSTRDDFDSESRGGEYRPPTNRPDRKAFDDTHRPRYMEDHRRPRGESPSRDRGNHDVIKSIDKDFEDIYNRTLQFKKKTEEMRRSVKRRGESEELSGPSNREYRQESPSHSPPHNKDRNSPENIEAPRFKRLSLNPKIKAKRDKAVLEICDKVINRHPEYHMEGEQKQRFMAELQLAIARIVFDMFGNSDVSFIEMVVKYEAKHNIKDEEMILREVLFSLPRQFRTIKRPVTDQCEGPAKMAKLSPKTGINENAVAHFDEANWSLNMHQAQMMQMFNVQQVMTPMVPVMTPDIVPTPFVQSYDEVLADQLMEMTAKYNLYLCKDDFSTFTSQESVQLKEFLVSQLVAASQDSQGWAPDFTIKGLQSMHRYEIVANDHKSKDWLINLDFSTFLPYTMFNVLVYTKEELWYERAAIWLPGHSRMRNIEPLDKLKLQNRTLEGVNIGKWKYVKKIVNAKGTRLYVDMPPSSARALEVHKMMLSYELQKVNVYLKAVAVDKNAFDAGMQEASLSDQGKLVTAVQQSPIPSLTYDSALVKVTLKGAKTMSISQARKIKEIIIYNLFQYLQQDGSSATDFTKYGFFPPCYFGIVPENRESKNWLLKRQFGKLNKTPIIVIGGDEDNIHYFRMTAVLPDNQSAIAGVTAKFKQGNHGVKGINFSRWKPLEMFRKGGKNNFVVDVDLESVETMAKMNFQLDYVGLSGPTHSVRFKPEYSKSKIEELIKKYKTESADSYDVANMELVSSDDDDVTCLD